MRTNRWLIAVAVVWGLSVAANAVDVDLTLYREGETYLRPAITLEGGAFSESKAWGESGLIHGRTSAIGAGSDGGVQIATPNDSNGGW